MLRKVRFKDNTACFDSYETVEVDECGYDQLLQYDASGVIDIVWERDFNNASRKIL